MTTLLAVGTYGLVWMARNVRTTDSMCLIAVALVSATLIGAGIGLPLRNVRLSLAIAFVVFLLIGLLMPLLIRVVVVR